MELHPPVQRRLSLIQRLRSLIRRLSAEKFRYFGKYSVISASVCAAGSLVSVFPGSEPGWYPSLSKFPASAPQFALIIVNTVVLAAAGALFGTVIPRCERRFLPYKGRGIILFCAAALFLWLWYPLDFTAESLYCGLCASVVCAVASLYAALYLSKLRLSAAAGMLLLFIWSLYLTYLSLDCLF